MTTELSTLTDIELAKMEVAINERGRELATLEGKKNAQLWAVNLLEYLALSGYKLPAVDKTMMAKIWADQLTEAIIIYGKDDIARVVKEWVKKDDREFKQFPTSGTILAEVKELLGNPVAEIARRNHEAYVKQVVDHEREELMKDATPEHLQELERRYKR